MPERARQVDVARFLRMAEVRLSLPSDAEISADSVELLSELPPLNIARMLARTGMAPEFYRCVRRLFDESWFPKEDREVMLFRTCWVNGSEYEIHQHRAYGGMSSSVIDSILSNDLSGLAPWHRALCRMCDEMAAAAKLTEQSVLELVEHYSSENIAARAIMVMAWFNMLGRFVDSTGVPVELGEDPYAGIEGPADSR
jgi:alkylhydroperoxidase family enzyme